MVVTENSELEKSVIAGVNCFAVPIEVFVPVEGEPVITTYTVCIDIARNWENTHSEDLLCEKALNDLEKEFNAVAEKLGYKHFRNENELMLEYIYTPDMYVPKREDEIKVHRITSNAVLQKICEASGCDIEIADDGEDVLFAVVEEGKLLAYAGINDICYEDGSVEISVETSPEHRKKGYGKNVVSALVRMLISNGKTVRYKCSAENTASSALCEKCGFVLEGKRYSFVCEKI